MLAFIHTHTYTLDANPLAGKGAWKGAVRELTRGQTFIALPLLKLPTFSLFTLVPFQKPQGVGGGRGEYGVVLCTDEPHRVCLLTKVARSGKGEPR